MEKMNPVVTALRDDIRRRQQVVQHIASLEEQLDSDRICGAWLAAQGTLTASLRRIGTATYRMLVYDHTLCYRRLVQDAVVTLRRHRLLFGEEEDCGANRVEYDSATDRLTLGCYGLFLPDDATHPAAEEFETPYGKTSGTPSGVAAPRRRGSPRPVGRLRSLEPRTGYRQLHQ